MNVCRHKLWLGECEQCRQLRIRKLADMIRSLPPVQQAHFFERLEAKVEQGES